MILPIYTYGQPVLRKVAEDITPDYPELKKLIENMFETMVHADGVGLAAPQIGLPIRVVTITLILCRMSSLNLKILTGHTLIRTFLKSVARKWQWKKVVSVCRVFMKR